MAKRKPKLVYTHPDEYTIRLKAGRRCIDPTVMPVIAAFLQYVQNRYRKMAAQLRGRTTDADPSVTAPLIERCDRIAETAVVMMTELSNKWPGIQWDAAAAEVWSQLCPEDGRVEVSV